MNPSLRLLALLVPGCEPALDTASAPLPHEAACAYVGVGGLLLEAADIMQYDSLATIHVSDEPWTISLVPNETSWLRFELEEARQLWLYADQAAVITELYRYDSSLGLPQGEPVDLCVDEIPAHHHLILTAGTYHLELAPSETDSLWLMLMEGA